LKISYKLTKNCLSYEAWKQAILVGLGYKTFSKKLSANSCVAADNNAFHTHLITKKIYNNVLYTYLHHP